MHIIETYWFIWLAGMGLFGGLAVFNQVRRIQNISNFSGPSDFFNGIGLMIAFAILAYASAALLFISVILNVISYVK